MKVYRLEKLGLTSFKYNYAGIRTAKINQKTEATTKYVINASTIVLEQKGDDVTTRINYYYGHNGVTGFKYLGNCYYYKKNFLGDIIGIYDDNDNLVARYVYDAWGNCKVLKPSGSETTESNFIGNINPFRYRSYYFDVETGLYYLQSRYYDPEVGRFISMDQVEYLVPKVVNGLNLYAYCLNNPVMGYDPEGNFFITGGAVAYLAYSGLALLGLGMISYAESESHIIENTITGIGELINDLKKPKESEVIDSESVLGATISLMVGTVTTVLAKKEKTEKKSKNKEKYQRKKAAPRKRFKSRKEAYESAKKRGKGVPPRLDFNDPRGPHYHPGVPNGSPYAHWHYYFPKAIIIYLNLFFDLFFDQDE